MDPATQRLNADLIEAWLRLVETRLDVLAPVPEGSLHDELGPTLEDRHQAALRHIHATSQRAERQGAVLPLTTLRRRFDLDDAETSVLMLALAPAIDASIRSRIARVNRNILLNYVSVDLALRLLHDERPSRLLSRRRLCPEGRLQRHGLVRVEPPKDMPSRQLSDAEISVPEELVAHLLGGAGPGTTIDAAVAAAALVTDPFADLVAAPEALEQYRLVLGTLRRLQREDPKRLPAMVISGDFGSGRRMLASRLARGLGMQVRRMRLDGLFPRADEWSVRLQGMLRDCLVEGLVPVFTDLEGLETKGPEDRERQYLRQTLLEAIDAHPGLVVLTTTIAEVSLQVDRAVWGLHIDTPAMELREVLWRRYLGADVELADPECLGELADLYPLTGGLIRRAAETARSRAAAQEGTLRVSMDDLRAGIRYQLAHRLGSVAEFIDPHGSWADVIVPKETDERLRQMVGYFKHRRTVWDDWGFRGKFSTLRGVSALFYGPPGTGKSFTAGVVGAELGMDLFRVDLSRIVSKWIGETEQNLARVFDEAARGHVVLFFDEADSLFTKRTEVSSSVDRYANLEVNYLLQRMERYEGVTILATNHEQSLDDAFKRRLQFRIHFPLPEKPERQRLWESLIPAQAAVGTTIDWGYLAEEFQMSGGHIRNAIVRAAFRAADTSQPIDETLLAWAAGAEYEEMGRLIRREGP